MTPGQLVYQAKLRQREGRQLARRIMPQRDDRELFVDLAQQHEREKMKRRKRKRRWK